MTTKQPSHTFQKITSSTIIMIGAIMIIASFLPTKEKRSYAAVLSGASLVMIGAVVFMRRPVDKPE